MKINFDNLLLNTKQILEKTSEKFIYEYYLNQNIQNGKLYKCPIHNDKSPSLGFYISKNNSLHYKCFGCGSQGNVFEFVKNIYNIDFKESVVKIQKDLNLKNNDKITVKNINNSNFNKNVELFENKKTKIIPTFRPFNKIDFDYWNSYYIPLELLIKYDIKACKLVYIINKADEHILWAIHQNNNPIYSYQIDDSFKIYRPLSDKKSKWLSNTDNFNIQGLKQLPDKGELLIITSSMKDVLVLNVMGYNAIALGGEGNNIPDKILDYLYACFDNIIVFYDNDEAGLKYGLKFSNQIGAGNIFIPLEYEQKDISDFVKANNLEIGKKLMKNLL